MEQKVAHCIYDHVVELIGDEKAAEVVALLVNLPIKQIKGYLRDYGLLVEYTTQAEEYLTKNPIKEEAKQDDD